MRIFHNSPPVVVRQDRRLDHKSGALSCPEKPRGAFFVSVRAYGAVRPRDMALLDPRIGDAFRWMKPGSNADLNFSNRNIGIWMRSEAHTSELQSLMHNSYAVLVL